MGLFRENVHSRRNPKSTLWYAVPKNASRRHLRVEMLIARAPDCTLTTWGHCNWVKTSITEQRMNEPWRQTPNLPNGEWCKHFLNHQLTDLLNTGKNISTRVPPEMIFEFCLLRCQMSLSKGWTRKRVCWSSPKCNISATIFVKSGSLPSHCRGASYWTKMKHTNNFNSSILGHRN